MDRKKRSDSKGGKPAKRRLTILLLMVVLVFWGKFDFLFKLTAEEIPPKPICKPLKAVIAVGDFAVEVQGAPLEIGDGLKEMLQTALFESGCFILIDRQDPAGLTAEQLLSDSFMKNPEAILSKGQMVPSELLIYGTVVALEGGGAGLRAKIPWLPLTLGGKYHEAKVALEMRIVDTSSSRVVAAQVVEGTATSGKSMVGTTVGNLDVPVKLELFQNTPLELAIRDCIHRAVVSLVKMIPNSFFRHSAL